MAIKVILHIIKYVIYIFLLLLALAAILVFIISDNNKYSKNSQKVSEVNKKNNALIKYLNNGGVECSIRIDLSNHNKPELLKSDKEIYNLVNSDKKLRKILTDQTINLYKENFPIRRIKANSLHGLLKEFTKHKEIMHINGTLFKEDAGNPYFWDILSEQLPPPLLKNLTQRKKIDIYPVFIPACNGTGYFHDSRVNYLENEDIVILVTGILSKASHKNKNIIYKDFFKGINTNNERYQYGNKNQNISLRILNQRIYDYYQKGFFQYPIVFFDLSSGCGAGEVDIKLKTNPSGGKIFYIPAFHAEVCRKYGKDVFNSSANDINSCMFWKEVNEGSISVAGVYYYKVFYKNTTLLGRFDITSKMADPNITLTLDLKSTKCFKNLKD